ncbi:glutamate--cysteine ligase [Alteromonadaceae bacterium M269]|nr:glutamate--cysteine ligase [Alteromonadaceae bacterium M269]
MAQDSNLFATRIAALAEDGIAQTLSGIKHGIEREALRINKNGSLAQTPHPEAFGSALSHDYVTTDFSESLLEFITPPEQDTQKTIDQLSDIHKFVQENLGDEQLWPLSMPCFINNQEHIPIAQYGSSNIGKMKALYRVGLKNRYGAMMQAIAGLHFNFSIPDDFWKQWLPKVEGIEANQDSVSAAYFSQIRNYRRFCWLIPYLYGSSPALCGSFLKGNESKLPFEKMDNGTYYLPYATSLRMSDLGYTNSAQSGLNICYNKVDTYIESLRSAIHTPSDEYLQYADKVDGELQQLNANVLQIENELYSPIRPKQPTMHFEKPTDALAARGVNYIEVRALDVNPFSAVGIDKQQINFLDVFLMYCAIAPSELMQGNDYQETEDNLSLVVEQGRKPGLMLSIKRQQKTLTEWAGEIFEEMREVARVMDKNSEDNIFIEAVENEWQKIVDPDKTFSGKLLKQLLSSNQGNGEFALDLAAQHSQFLENYEYKHFSAEQFAEFSRESVEKQKLEEASDTEEFEVFLENYFRVTD